jgi:hypothetical protein
MLNVSPKCFVETNAVWCRDYMVLVLTLSIRVLLDAPNIVLLYLQRLRLVC